MLQAVHKQPKAIADELNQILKAINSLPSYKEEDDGSITVTINGKEYSLQPK